MAVTTMACERCCLKYEKPVSQLYTPHPPHPLGSPRLPSHNHSLHLPSAGSSLLPFQKTELFPTCELQLHFPGQSSGGNVAPAGATSPLPSAALGARPGPGRGRARRWVGLTLICWRRAAKEGRRGRWAEAGAGRRCREGWSAPPSLALGVLTVPKLKLSAAASAGKLRGARGPRTKLEKSKQAAAAGEPPSFPLRPHPSRPCPAASFQQLWGERVRLLTLRLLTFTSPLFLSFFPFPLPALCRPW